MSVIIAIVFWVLGTLAIFVLSQGKTPFDLKLFEDKGTPFLGEVIALEIGLAFPIGLIAIIYLITRNRVVPDLRTRAPEIPVARAETLGVVGYAVVAQTVGGFPRPGDWSLPCQFAYAGDTVWAERTVYASRSHYLVHL